MDEQDKQRKSREEARNQLEAFIYQTMDKLTSEDIIKVSQEPERDALNTDLSADSEWLSDEGDMPATPTEEFKKRLGALKGKYEPVGCTQWL